MKSLTVLSVLAGALVVFGVVVTANNITWGTIAPYDRLLATDYVFKPSSWLTVQKAEVVYPPKVRTITHSKVVKYKKIIFY